MLYASDPRSALKVGAATPGLARASRLVRLGGSLAAVLPLPKRPRRPCQGVKSMQSMQEAYQGPRGRSCRLGLPHAQCNNRPPLFFAARPLHSQHLLHSQHCFAPLETCGFTYKHLLHSQQDAMEMGVLLHLRHPGVVAVYDCITDLVEVAPGERRSGVRAFVSEARVAPSAWPPPRGSQRGGAPARGEKGVAGPGWAARLQVATHAGECACNTRAFRGTALASPRPRPAVPRARAVRVVDGAAAAVPRGCGGRRAGVHSVQHDRHGGEGSLFDHLKGVWIDHRCIACAAQGAMLALRKEGVHSNVIVMEVQPRCFGRDF